MAASDDTPQYMVVFFIVFYSTVFLMSTVGNTWVIITCYKNLKQRHFPLMWLVANLAFADLLFTFLTILNVIAFLWRWVGGEGICKLHGFLVEATYTTSITTLVLITFQRLKAITDPFKARINSWASREYMKLAIIWFLCFTVCSPLMPIYRVVAQENGAIVCVNTKWGDIGRQIYYSIHAIFFFAIPLLYMIFTQSLIHRALQTRVVSIISNSYIARSNQRHKKVAKTLAALSVAFVLCWSPFMVIRTLIYFHLASPDLIWRAAQLLICLNAALDPILYGYYGGNLKSVLKRLVRCNFAEKRFSNSTSVIMIRANASTYAQEHTHRRTNDII